MIRHHKTGRFISAARARSEMLGAEFQARSAEQFASLPGQHPQARLWALRNYFAARKVAAYYGELK